MLNRCAQALWLHAQRLRTHAPGGLAPGRCSLSYTHPSDYPLSFPETGLRLRVPRSSQRWILILSSSALDLLICCLIPLKERGLNSPFKHVPNGRHGRTERGLLSSLIRGECGLHAQEAKEVVCSICEH